MVALMVADLSFLSEFQRKAAFCGKEDLPTIQQLLQESFWLEDEQKPNINHSLCFRGYIRRQHWSLLPAEISGNLVITARDFNAVFPFQNYLASNLSDTLNSFLFVIQLPKSDKFDIFGKFWQLLRMEDRMRMPAVFLISGKETQSYSLLTRIQSGTRYEIS